MADNAYGPRKEVKPEGAVSKKSDQGAHGGGTPYHQAKVGKGFMAVPPFKGHSQKSNLK